MFLMFNGEGDPRIDTAPHHVPGSGSTGHGLHRHRGTVPGIIRRLALRRHVRGQRFSLPAPIRDPGQERIRHSRCGAAVCGRHGTSARIPDGQRHRVHQLGVVEYCNSLQIGRELTAPYTPQQNGPVESGLSRALKAGHAARLEVNKLFPDVHVD